MSKAIEGAALIGLAGVGLAAMTFATGGLGAFANTVLFGHIVEALALGGVSMEAGAIASALTANRGTNITTRQAAAFRQIIYGEQRVGGVLIYKSTTGGKHDQVNYVIVLAGHPCESIVNLYLDGRRVYWNPTNTNGNTTRPDGTNFGGAAAGGDRIGPDGQTYNFGGLVYCEARYGDQLEGDVITGLTANDPKWAPSAGGSPWVGGCTYIYLKREYDVNMFPSDPEIRVTVRGKNNIMDPRTGLRGYTHNWALVVADVIEDTQFGLGDVGGVNTAQLIAAANVCDEVVPLANGGTELRYSCHWHFDTSVDPGNALNTMMPAAAGRLSQIGGEWYIWPAYWQGPTFSFDEGALTGSPTWTPNRSLRDLFNFVTGTYIAPNYPYNDAGNVYDSAGWYDGTLANTFPFGFQPTSAPQYACDPLHGYPVDEYLADDGRPLPHEVSQSCLLSVAQWQRVAKIMLLRNRQQGSGNFPMNLAAWEMQPLSVMNFTFPAMGWSEKVFEIGQTRLSIDYDGEAPVIRFSVNVNETSETVYEWSTTEELSVYDVPVITTRAPYTPAAPTGMTLTSGASTAVQTADGVVHPRIEVQWNVPLDILTRQIQVMYAPTSTPSPWLDNGLVDVANTLAFIPGVVAGQQYNVRIRGLRANGAASPWVEIDGYEVVTTLSVVGITALAQNALIGEAFVDGTAGILVSPFPASVGNVSVSVLSSGAYDITGLAQTTPYFVYYVDPTFAGGAITPIATTNQADFLNKQGYFLIGSIVTPYRNSSGSTARYTPASFNDLGSYTTSSPSSASDGNTATSAVVGSRWRAPSVSGGDPTITTGDATWSGFPGVRSTAGMSVNIVASFTSLPGSLPSTIPASGSIEVTGIGSQTFSTTIASATYTFAIPTGTDLSTLVVEVTCASSQDDADSTAGTQTKSAALAIYEIFIQ